MIDPLSLLSTDPRIVIRITPQWPDGTYALPMPQGGCPSRWSSGYRYQDTEDRRNSNGKSSGIERKMKVVVGSNIRFYYCVKTVRETQATAGQGDPTALQRRVAVHVDSDMEASIGMMKIVAMGIGNGVLCPMVAMGATQRSNTVVVTMAVTAAP